MNKVILKQQTAQINENHPFAENFTVTHSVLSVNCFQILFSDTITLQILTTQPIICHLAQIGIINQPTYLFQQLLLWMNQNWEACHLNCGKKLVVNS